MLHSPNLIGDTSVVRFELNRGQTQLLQTKANEAYHTEINDLLLTALSRALVSLFGAGSYSVTLEGHGREEVVDVDVSRTVGWFTTMFPVLLDYEEEPGYHLQVVKEGLRRVPNKGIGYGVLKYLSQTNLGADKSQLSFNYLGEFSQDSAEDAFSFSFGQSGIDVSVLSHRDHELDVLGLISQGRLQVMIHYSSKRMEAGLMDLLIKAYEQSLKDLIGHCSIQEKSQKSPSDYTGCSLSLSDYESFLLRTGAFSGQHIRYLSIIYPSRGDVVS